MGEVGAVPAWLDDWTDHMMIRSSMIGPAIAGGGRRAASAPAGPRVASARDVAVAERIAATCRRHEPWSGWREHRIESRDVAVAWAVAALFLTVLLAATL